MADAGPGPFRAWSLPPAEETFATSRQLPPARTREDETPDLALLAALPSGSEVRAVLARLRSAREPLLDRPAGEIAGALGAVGARLLEPSDPLREEALALLPGSTGLSAPMCRRVLDGMARDWTPERLRRLVELEFPGGELDGFGPPDGEGRRIRALGPPVAFHLAAGTVPGVSLTSLLRSLLVKTPVLLKPGRGDVVLPVLFHRALLRSDPALAAAAAVAYWPGGSDAAAGAEEAALSGAGLVVAYGGTSTIADLRRRLPADVPLVAYHHRVGVAAVGRGGTEAGAVEAVGRRLAEAAALFDQRGCVSPLAVYAVGGGVAAARRLAGAVAGALEELDRALPPGRMDEAQASEVRQARDTDELRRAAGEIELWGVEGGRWSVTLEAAPDGGPGVEPACLDRTVRVVPVADPEELARRLGPLARHLQTVGHAGFTPEALERLAEALARSGALRIAALDEVAFPPPWWIHDGAGPLEALVGKVELSGR